MALAMKVISQVEAQRKILEEAVSTALELASGKSDGAEVAVGLSLILFCLYHSWLEWKEARESL